jgi:23S rRNA pseudouridine1911/1915/1917 synthase
VGAPLRLSVAVARTERLDRFLADQLALSRTQAARLVAGKAVRVNGEVARASRVLERGDVLEVTAPEPEARRPLRPAAIALTVVWEDEHFAVIDKPAGLVVHPAPGHWEDTLVNALVARGTPLSAGAEGRPGIVHRLDRDTSGLLLVAKTDVAHRRLGAMIAARRVHRAYAALAWGHFPEDRTVLDQPIGRHPRDRKRMAVLAGGRSARTDVRVVARFGPADLVRCELHTGRTHQIRVHLAHAGHPVVGDPVYHEGGARRIGGAGKGAAEQLAVRCPRQALHAAELRLRHPVTGTALAFTSEWPADLRPALAELLGPDDAVAGPEPLRYLRFFKADG